MDELTREAFLKHLREALHYLYDTNRLRQNPLTGILNVGSRLDASLELRQILLDAIAALKPPADEPPLSRGWRTYNALFCCYVQQLSQRIAADQLAISPRQLRREQSTALEVLADKLWKEFALEERMHGENAEQPPQESHLSPTANEELAWLKEAPLESPTDPGQVLNTVVELMQPLAAQHNVRLKLEKADALPELVVHPVALNQTLLNLLSVAVPRCTGAQITITARPGHAALDIAIQGESASAAPSGVSDNDIPSLAMASQLATLSGGKLKVGETSTNSFDALLTLPALEQLPVLVIDDNPDTLQLLSRYTSGTRYRLITTQDPEQVLKLAVKVAPQIIVLDVMMPQVDGWQVLARLRHHPLTQRIPIIVCTILPQEALALSLGASALIRKPLTRQDFLAVLDEQLSQMETESH